MKPIALAATSGLLLATPAWAADTPMVGELRAIKHKLVNLLVTIPPGAWIIAGAVVVALVAFAYGVLRKREPADEQTSSVFGQRGRQELPLSPTDFETFQGLVEDLNAIWRAQDINALSQVASADMATRLSARLQSQLAQDKGWTVHELQVLRSELVDAWREGSLDHAQMNLRLSTLESAPEETPRRFVSREIWSFERTQGGNWLIAGVCPVE